MTELGEVVVLPIDLCRPVSWNPNEEDPATFNELVESIREDGFNDPLTVCPVADGMGWDIIAGEHRWKAAKIAGLSFVTAVVKEWDPDEQKVKSVRHNVVRGKLQPEKFTEIWKELEKKYGRSTLMRKMGMTHKEKELERLTSSIARKMPEEMAQELRERAKNVRNVEDLAVVVQSLYAEHGSTLDSSYMLLTFGGQVHLMIRMTDDNRKLLIEKLTDFRAKGIDANAWLKEALDDL